MTRSSLRRVVTSLVVASVVAAGFVASPEASASKWEYSWAVPEWRATWSAPRFAEDRGFAVQATGDAVYTAGLTGSNTVGTGDLALLRYDLDGELVWSRTWGGFELDQAQAIEVTEDGIWVAGSGTSDEGGIFAVLLRFSHDGDLLFERTWSRGVIDVLQAVTVHGDSLYVAGLTHPERNVRNIYVARIDLDGTTVWEIERGGDGWDEAWDVAVDDAGVYVGGYLTEEGAQTSQSLVWLLDHDGNHVAETSWGGPANDEVRAIALSDDALFVTGGAQTGSSTDVFVGRLDRSLGIDWIHTTQGKVTGGGGYGLAVGEQGIYVAGGNYDFPAGGDAAILRFSFDGDLEWSQILGYPAFWDWSFDMDVRDGRFYVAGVMWTPGAEWYEITTIAYDEDLPRTTLTETLRRSSEGDGEAARALEHFWLGDFLRWADEVEASDPGRSYVYWEGASSYGRTHGVIWADSDRDSAVGQENAVEAFSGLADDMQSGNYALVRNYTGVRGSLLDGLVRFRYYISHDRLIPQGGYVYVGQFGVALPPPPV